MRISTLPEEDQFALGRELTSLATEMGPTWLLEAPSLLARHEDFPDEWRPDLEGAELMLERLLTYAGLGELPFAIEPYSSQHQQLTHVSTWHRSGAGLGVRIFGQWGLLLGLVLPLVSAMRRSGTLECSHCEASVGEAADQCPFCRARFVATVATRHDRLKAEDRWRRANAPSS